MTQTLTTEQLRAHAESLGLDFFIERRAGILVKEWLKDGCTSATAEEVLPWSMLANREAQPVGVDIERIERHVLHAVACPPYSRVVLFSSLQRLFAAPPAPVVNPEFTGATAVPTFEAWLSTQENKQLGWVRDSMKESYDACRAAMLAQPVSQGYKLPPHAYRELVNSLRDTAVKYSGTDQLREHLSTALSQFIEPDHHHTRTGAPDRN